MPSIYMENGYNTRREYLEDLALEYKVSIETVRFYANLLGSDEDFYLLPVYLQDRAKERKN